MTAGPSPVTALTILGIPVQANGSTIFDNGTCAEDPGTRRDSMT
jgi:hypothetical protein